MSSANHEPAVRTNVRHWSIARRLAISHIAAVCISYALFGVLFYSLRTSQQRASDRQEMADEINGVKAMLREPNCVEVIDAELRSQIFESNYVHPFLRVLDREGRVVRESPGMERIVPRSAFAHQMEHLGCGGWRNREGDYFLVRSVGLEDNALSGPGGVLQVGMSARETKEMGSQLRYALFAFVSSGVAFAFVCAFAIIKFGLRPLESISQTARSITQRELHTRIDSGSLPLELVSLAESFNNMLARLENSFDKLSHYSGNLAHELRTPINTLMIAADIALSRERDPEEYRSVITSSMEEFEKLSLTIDRMLFLARADIQQHDLTLQNLDVASEIENLFDYYSETALEAGVALESSGFATLYADQTLFRRALSNLINNSLAYTEPGDSIALAVRQVDGIYTEVVVGDNGCGIGEEHLPKLFDRFYRAPGGGGKGVEGTGLGLAIVKAIMQMHGGTVTIENRAGGGALVTLRFPAPASSVLGEGPPG
jgi:two-component system, OmpR family, heavy metal sensor histidine kinase CusS